MRDLNKSTEATLIVKAESMNRTHLPSTDVVADVIIFLCCYYHVDCVTKNSTNKFLTHNLYKNINEIHAKLYST